LKKESKFEDYQESQVYDGDKKHKLKVILINDLVGSLQKGDRVTITGVLRSRKGKSVIFEHYIEAASIKKEDVRGE